jgi:RND family efflux transporter MFP subunit
MLLFGALARNGSAEGKFIAQGVTEPLVDEQLSCLVRGLVGKILVKEGDAVKKDDVIIELRKNLEAFEVERRQLIWESKAELKSAESRVETVAQDLEATRRLYHSTKSVSKEKLLEKELEHKLAQAELERQKTEEELQRIEAEMAKEQLSLREIRSPIDGVITKLFLHPGENAEPGQPLVRVVDTKTCNFVTNIEAKIVRSLKEGQKVRLEIEAGDQPVIKEGAIAFVSPVVDPASGLQEVKVRFDNSQGDIRPGVAGKMYIQESTDVAGDH